MKRILVVDVGNTRAKFGVFEVGGADAPQVVGITAVRLAESSDLSEDLASWLSSCEEETIAFSMLSGSNPPARDQLLEHWPLDHSKPCLINDASDIPLAVDVDDPSTVGIDRLLTAYAAQSLVSARQPVVVIDSGTATTVNLMTSDGTFRGGAILPGLRLSAYALHDYTARLPMINTDLISTVLSSVDAPVPGRNTIDAMKSGLFWGQLGAIRELSSRLRSCAENDFEEAQPAVVVLTGGGGRQLAGFLANSVYIDSLTLHGLARLAAEEHSQL